jgi:hypothetical protein
VKHDEVGRSARPYRHQFRQPKIQNLCLATLGREDVRWLDVAVHDPPRWYPQRVFFILTGFAVDLASDRIR